MPWRGISAKDIVKSIEAGKRLDKPANVPTGFWDFTLQTWLFGPTERPEFSAISSGLLGSLPAEAKVSHDSTQSGQLHVRRGNKVYILGDSCGGDLVLAQSVSSLEIGMLPKSSTDHEPAYLQPREDARARSKIDISHPVENSFIHAAHGDGQGGDSWGEAGSIDPTILANPIMPNAKPVTKRPVPTRPPMPAKVPPQKPPATEDLLGSLDDELKQRPVTNFVQNFSDMHAQIAQSFSRTPREIVSSVPTSLACAIRRNDSFESATEDEFEPDGYSEVYHRPDLKVYESARQPLESYESVYEVPDLDSDKSHNAPKPFKEPQVPLPIVSQTLPDVFSSQFSLNSSSHDPVQAAFPVPPCSERTQISFGSNPFGMDAFIPPTTVPTASNFLAPKSESTANNFTTNPFTEIGTHQSANQRTETQLKNSMVRQMHLVPLSPVKRSLTPEPKRSSNGFLNHAVNHTPTVRSLTPNLEVSSSNPFLRPNTQHVQSDKRKMSLPINEHHFSDLESRAFDWFKTEPVKPGKATAMVVPPISIDNPAIPLARTNQSGTIVKAPEQVQSATYPKKAQPTQTNAQLLGQGLHISDPQKSVSTKPIWCETKEGNKQASGAQVEATKITSIPVLQPTRVALPPKSEEHFQSEKSPHIEAEGKTHEPTKEINTKIMQNPVDRTTTMPSKEPAQRLPTSDLLGSLDEAFKQNPERTKNVEPKTVEQARTANPTIQQVPAARPSMAIAPVHVTNVPRKPLVKQRSVSSSSATASAPTAPDIAFMSSSDAVEALRKKYGLISNEAAEPKAPSNATAPDTTKRDIFDTGRKKSAMEVKQHELQVATLVKQCPGATHFQAENALKANGFNVPRALKMLKVI